MSVQHLGDKAMSSRLILRGGKHHICSTGEKRPDLLDRVEPCFVHITIARAARRGHRGGITWSQYFKVRRRSRATSGRYRIGTATGRVARCHRLGVESDENAQSPTSLSLIHI